MFNKILVPLDGSECFHSAAKSRDCQVNILKSLRVYSWQALCPEGAKMDGGKPAVNRPNQVPMQEVHGGNWGFYRGGAPGNNV